MRGSSNGWPIWGAQALTCLRASTTSDEGVPLTKPVVTREEKEWENIVSQPRVLPFLRTSDLRKMISTARIRRFAKSKDRGEGHRTEMRILVILVEERPEERSHDGCGLDGAEREPEGADHRFVRGVGEGYDEGSECFVLLALLLHTFLGMSSVSSIIVRNSKISAPRFRGCLIH